MNYVIIGNGIAGLSAAESIRQLDSTGHIFMISDEPLEPYCRPMISLVLQGVLDPSKLPIRKSGLYQFLNITPVLGNRVVQMDADRKTLLLSDGQILPFDRLLIATGADPRPIKAAGSHLHRIFFMRNRQHVMDMLEALPETRRALVIGGGLVGFKAVYGLLHRGVDVTMLIRSGYPLSLQVDADAGAMILRELVRHGLNVRVGAGVTAFTGNMAVTGAVLSDGSELPCDMVIIGKGVLPSVSFIPKDKVQVDLGVVVNAHMETTCPGVFAAGDVAESVDIARKTRWVNAIWPEAAMQGRLAGMNMAGRSVACNGSLSRNVIRIFDLDVMTAGWNHPPDDPRFEILTRFHPRSNTYRRLVFEGNRLIGATLVNHIESGGILMTMIQNAIPISIPRRNLLQFPISPKSVMF